MNDYSYLTDEFLLSRLPRRSPEQMPRRIDGQPLPKISLEDIRRFVIHQLQSRHCPAKWKRPCESTKRAARSAGIRTRVLCSGPRTTATALVEA